ncbi:hypothetical protein V8E36_008487 [Tilletia maclaganii]
MRENPRWRLPFYIFHWAPHLLALLYTVCMSPEGAAGRVSRSWGTTCTCQAEERRCQTEEDVTWGIPDPPGIVPLNSSWAGGRPWLAAAAAGACRSSASCLIKRTCVAACGLGERKSKQNHTTFRQASVHADRRRHIALPGVVAHWCVQEREAQGEESNRQMFSLSPGGSQRRIGVCAERELSTTEVESYV